MSIPLLILALSLAATMGFAIQRGATCTVAAVEEWMNQRSVRRLTGMLEASLWVAGGMLIAHALHPLGMMPAGHPLSWFTVAGGVLLGVGAFVNRACVFGAIARLGSGEWAYVATPAGFYAGCLSVAWIAPSRVDTPLMAVSPIFQAGPAVAVLALAFMLVRVSAPLVALWHAESRDTFAVRLQKVFSARLWTPHAATGVIGVTFLFLLLLKGAWAYTDVLADAARGMAGDLVARGALFLALLGGAVIGGWTAGRFKPVRLSLVLLARCFAGGLLMGWGSLLIPGSNDGLILLGMPLLWPYAWVAFAAMCVSIAAAMWVASRVG